MSATEEESIEKADISSIKKLGIIAGGGSAPVVLQKACDELNIDYFTVAFEGQTDQQSYDEKNHILTRLGAVGHVLKTLKSENISDIVMIGSIRRPSLKELRPDVKAAAFFAKEGAGILGDDGLLKALKSFLEKEGMCVHAAQDFATSLLAPSGPVGRLDIPHEYQDDVEYGIKILHETASLDIGQSVVIQQGLVIGLEAIEGTSELMRRCKALQREGRAGVLVKMPKTQQTRDLDLPAIGPDTVRMAVQSGLSGIIVRAKDSLIINKEEVAQIADQHKIFVVGI